jgi:uncharacterized protein YbaR (Trm112 family)
MVFACCSDNKCFKPNISYHAYFAKIGNLMMDTKLLQILVCPVTKGPLIFNKTTNELISKSASLAYPVKDGIPVMLEEEARKLTDEEVA